MCKAFDISGSVYEEACRFYGNHLIALAGLSQPLHSNGKPDGETNCFFYSGFVMVIRRRWYFVTAGHILENIESSIKKGKVKVSECRLVDYYGQGTYSKEPIPFDYNAAYKYYYYSETEGLDFGVLEINSNQQKLLKANKVKAVLKNNWEKRSCLTFDRYFMLGLPSDCIQRGNTYNRDGYIIQGSAVPNAIYIKEVKRPIKKWIRPYKRFIGKIPGKHKVTVGDIEGMSGGPIFGFAKEEPGQHYIVAVQSTWIKNRDITFGVTVHTPE